MKTTVLLAVFTSAVLLAPIPAYAQAKGNKTTKKPAPSHGTSPKPGNRQPIVLGTTQLPGDFGQFGQTYTVGKQNPINVTLNRAEYQIGRFNVGDSSHVPEAEQKLLVLHYTVHNPTTSEQRFFWNSLGFVGVDRKDVNHQFIKAVTREGTSDMVDVTLKPAQKLEVQSALLVPAAGVVPKLILQREEGAPVVRYDLRGKVAPLPAPFADPSDASGATVQRTIPAQTGIFYPLGVFDVRLDTVAYMTDPLGDGEQARAPGTGKRYVAIVCTLRNSTNAEQRYFRRTFTSTLTDADGETVAWNEELLKATRNEEADGSLKPGQEARVRFYFVMPAATGAKAFTLAARTSNNNTVAFAFALGSIK